MAIIESLLKMIKSNKLRPEEVSIEQKRLEVHERKLLNEIERLENERNELFKKGADSKSQHLRRVYARQFDEKGKQLLMKERQLFMLEKELAVIGRLKMALDANKKKTSSLLRSLSDSNLREIQTLIEKDNIKEEEFIEKLDTMLGLTSTLGEATLEGEGAEVMKIWEKMDQGQIDVEEALKMASKTTAKEAPEKGTEEKISG